MWWCLQRASQVLVGEFAMGMGRAFQYAGAQAVLMSHRTVAERFSVILVEWFFRHGKEGKSKIEALQEARFKIYERPVTTIHSFGLHSFSWERRTDVRAGSSTRVFT